jgi:lysophospholipase L1-like esterase
MKQIIKRAHAQGLKIFGGTMLPYYGAMYFSEEGEAKRQAVNEWIRTSNAFDGVVDFDEALRDPADPEQYPSLNPIYDGGDNLHPNDAGYERMAEEAEKVLFGWRHRCPCNGW